MRDRRVLPGLLSVAGSLSAALPALAQSAVNTLPEVVVSGSRTERPLQDVPAVVDVLQGADLDPARVQDIRDLARALPNVSVRRAAQRFGAVAPGYRPGMQCWLQHSRSGGQPGAADRGWHPDAARALQRCVRNGSTGVGVGVGLTLAGRSSDTLRWLTSLQGGSASELNNQGSNTAENSARTAPNPQSDQDQALLAKWVLTPDTRQTHTLSLEHVDKSSDIQALTARGRSMGVQTRNLDRSTDMQRSRLSWDGRFALGAAGADTLRATLDLQDAHSRELARADETVAGERAIAPAMCAMRSGFGKGFCRRRKRGIASTSPVIDACTAPCRSLTPAVLAAF